MSRRDASLPVDGALQVPAIDFPLPLQPVGPQRRLQGGQRHFVEAKSPHQRIFFDSLDEVVAAGENAGLGSAKKLVPAE